MEALVLVCALAVSAPECRPETALRSFYAPGSATDIAGCLREGMLFAAESELVVAGSYPKIVCNPPGRMRITEKR